MKMSKSVLIVETPKNCGECKLTYCNHNNDYFCSLTGEFIYHYIARDIKSLYCPLLPLPEKKDSISMYGQGWNDCLDEIVKEK